MPNHWAEICGRFYEMIRALRLGVRHGMPPWLAAEPPFVWLTTLVQEGRWKRSPRRSPKMSLAKSAKHAKGNQPRQEHSACSKAELTVDRVGVASPASGPIKNQVEIVCIRFYPNGLKYYVLVVYRVH